MNQLKVQCKFEHRHRPVRFCTQFKIVDLHPGSARSQFSISSSSTGLEVVIELMPTFSNGESLWMMVKKDGLSRG